MLQENALRDPAPASIIGQHVTPELQVGKVGFRSGPFMASSDELYVTVKGKGGHAAAPEKLIDPILIAAHLITVLQQVVSRRARPATPTVLSFGKVIANGATNVVPNEVKLEGTLRTFDGTWRAEMHALLPKMAQDLAASMGGSCDFEVRKGYPAVVNDEALTIRLRANAEAYLGAENVVGMDQRMGSEDFAFYTQVMPGCFYRLGTGDPAKPTGGLHTSTFNIDEEALRIGSGLMAWNAIAELGVGPSGDVRKLHGQA
ncbi:MAG: amidohydrolase [Flavobacteriales bacterium]